MVHLFYITRDLHLAKLGMQQQYLETETVYLLLGPAKNLKGVW